ncbi:MAG: ABC transporter substrate-binding protein [Acidimicrobiales bacterium]
MRIAAMACAITLLTAACGDDDEGGDDTTTTTAATEPAGGDNTGDGELKIGYLLPESGDLGFLGPPMVGGVEMAVEEINAAGGVLGKDIVLVGQDDGTDPEVAGTGADSLLADDVDFIVGPAGSSIALSVLDKITGAGIPMCSPSNTGVQFTTVDDNGGYYFRTAPPDNLQAQVLADLIVSDGHQNVVVIAQSTEYGEGFAEYLVEELNALGATAPDPILYDAEAGSYQAEAEQIAGEDPDAVAVISYAEGAQIITSAIAEGIGPQDGVQWYGADGIQGSSFWESVDADDPTVVEGIRGTAPSAAPADGEATFRDRFEAFAPGVDTIYSGHAYDCVVLAALAATAAESDAPADIQAGIIDASGEGEKCALVEECLELLAGDPGADIDYDGAAGPLDFVEAGEPGAGAYDTWTFDAQGAVSVIEESIPVAGDG